MADNPFVVIDGFYGEINGKERIFRRGDVIQEGDPALKKWPHLFVRQNIYNQAPIEQATAAPGEKR